jgi:hypothetical protein
MSCVFRSSRNECAATDELSPLVRVLHQHGCLFIQTHTHTYGRLKYRMVGRRMRAWAESFVDAFASRKRCPPNAHVFFFSSSILLLWKPLELLFSRATWIIHRLLSLLVNELLVVLSVVKWYRRRMEEVNGAEKERWLKETGNYCTIWSLDTITFDRFTGYTYWKWMISFLSFLSSVTSSSMRH